MFKNIDSEQIMDECINGLENKALILYGAGNYGVTTKRYIERFYDTEIKCFAVSDLTSHETIIDEKKVINISDADRKSTLIICISEQRQRELIDNAERMGFTDVYVMLNEFVRYMQSELNERRLIPHEKLNFEVHITDHCNLNCRGCYHFSPVSKPYFLSVHEFDADMSEMKRICGDKVSSITLLGGEPLLHPEIIKFFEIARGYFSTCRIDLLTNGTLIKNMGEDFWEALVDNRITLCCTRYPVYVDYDFIEQKASKYNLHVIYHNDVGAGEKTLIKYPFDITGSQDIEWNYKHCTRSNKCITLKHGRIFTCPMAAHAHLAKEYFGLDIELSPLDSIDIYTVNSLQEITEFLVNPIPFCRYCNLQKKAEQTEWQVSERKLEEWF